MNRIATSLITSLLILVVTSWGQPANSLPPGLLDAVEKIGKTGIPGPLAIYGEAFPVVLAKLEKQSAAVVAAAKWGKGRWVVWGHGGYFGSKPLASHDTGKLMCNLVRWAAGRSQGQDRLVRVAVIGAPELANFLRGQGFQVGEPNARDLPRLASQCDVVAIDSHRLSDTDVAELRKLVSSGKGVVTAGLAWGWSQLNPGKLISTDHPGNRLLAGTGIAFADGYLDGKDNGFAAREAPSPLSNATAAWTALVDQHEKRRKLTRAEIQQATSAVGLAARFAHPESNPILSAVLKYADRVPNAGIVSPAKPVNLESGLERAVLTARLVEVDRLPIDKIKADPNAVAFPGAVDAKAPKVKKTLTLKTDLPGWKSTGLYAAPGEVVEVGLPAAATKAKLSLRIGCHTDELWHLDTWKRCPSISRSWALTQSRQRVASPFGGLIYLEVPERCELGQVELTVGNAVESAQFILGKTSLENWKKSERQKPAPWAELHAKNVIITVPARAIRKLDDPELLLRHWDDVMAACAALGPRPLRYFRPERYVPDEQISAGYMHSGYPIMTHLDAVESMVSHAKLKAGEGASWGLYHEMGHNHQHGDWTFDGTGEVTVNLFTLYVMDKVCGRPRQGHDSLKFGPARQKLLRDYLATGPDFRKWKEDPFLALHMYLQLEEAFGWPTFQKVFTEYRNLPREQKPKNDDAKRDQWLVRFSTACGKNLGPFFDAWGVPVSEAAKAEVAHLPLWMPSEWPKAR